MEIQRTVLLIALAFVLLFLWQNWLTYQEEKTPSTTQSPATDSGGVPSLGVEPRGEGPGGEIPDAPSAPVTVVSDEAAPAAADLQRGERILVETDILRAEIDALGGDLRRVELLKHPVSVDTPDEPFPLLKEDDPDLFVAQSGLIGADGEYPNHKTRFTLAATNLSLKEGEATLRVPLAWVGPDGVKYQKIYIFHRDSYEIDIEYVIENHTDKPWNGYLYAQFLRTQVVDKNGGFLFMQALPSYKGGAIYTPDERYEKIDFAEMMEQNLEREVNSGWVAMLQHYFVSAWLPAPDSAYQFYSRVDRRPGGPRYNLGYKTLQPKSIGAGESGVLRTRLYAGPKEQDRLEKPAEGLILTVDYGWLTPVASPLFWILRMINKVLGNWGWSIIVLTFLIKLVFYPLSAASYKSMARMKKLQPRLKTLRERYGDDKQKLNQAMMEMYKKDKINPLGGCLPIVIQIPVFIALYWVLLESVELRQAPFALWLNDLSLRDPYFVLPVLMGASMFAQQLLNPAPLDPIQKNIMMALPVVFTVFFLWFPAGLVLYWLVNNVLSIAQQWYITHNLQAAGS